MGTESAAPAVEGGKTLGLMWWTAESEEEFGKDVLRLVTAGALLMKTWVEKDRRINYTFKLPKEDAERIIGYVPEEVEWLTEQDKALPSSPVTSRYGPETVIIVGGGFALRCPAHPAECEYLRVTDADGREVGYWQYDQWVENPTTTMGEVIGALKVGIDTGYEFSPVPPDPDGWLVDEHRITGAVYENKWKPGPDRPPENDEDRELVRKNYRRVFFSPPRETSPVAWIDEDSLNHVRFRHPMVNVNLTRTERGAFEVDNTIPLFL